MGTEQVFCQTMANDSVVNKTLTTAKQDSLTNQADSSLITLTDTVNIVYDDGDIDGPITYRAEDSIVYDLSNEKMYLYNGAYMKYTNLELESDEIEFDWTSYTLTSRGKMDSTGKVIEDAKFTETSGTYSADSMQYNFKTKKGRTFAVVTEQDGAFIHSDIVQKNEFDEWYGYKTKYTTCSNTDHPHFYLAAKKSKVVPDKVMVTGPVNLVVGGINTPLLLPFGIFPTKAGQRSGIIMPQYGEQPTLGFFLKEGGYYWAVNDRLALTFLGTVYTKGRFGVSAKADYNKRYKYNGGLFFSYFRTPPRDRFLANASAQNDYRIEWNHRMDGKARPNNSFSANITGASSNFNNNSLETSNQLLEVRLNSNLNYVRRFQGKPYSFSISARHDQNLKTRQISLTLPEVAFNVSRFTPFQKKIQTQKKRFHENIGFTYSAKTKATVSTIDSLLFRKDNLDDIQYGIIQTATVDAPFNLAKFFTIRPAFNYNERWYFKREDRSFFGDSIMENGEMVFKEFLSTIDKGFFGVRDFNFRTDISTTLTGIYNFKNMKNVKALRHIMKPSLNYTFRPDFSDSRWNYYDSYYNPDQDITEEYNRYSVPNNQLYGVPGSGMNNVFTFNLQNNFEFKTLNKKDTTQQFKKIPLIEQLNFSTGYDFTADSLKISPFIINARSNIFNGLISWNIQSTFSPYALSEKTARNINKTYFSTNKRLVRFDNARISLNFNLRGKSKTDEKPTLTQGTINEREYVLNNPQLFYDFNIPWSLSVGYNLNLEKGIPENLSQGIPGNIDTTNITVNSLTLSGHINITPKWQLNLSTGYDLKRKDLTLTNVRVERDLHCWLLAFNWTAYPLNRQTYAIELRVKSPILQELKLSRKQPPGVGGDDF